MQKVVKALEGRKTYITAAVLALLNLAVAFNLISPDHLVQINFILTALGLGALRSSISKL